MAESAAFLKHYYSRVVILLGAHDCFLISTLYLFNNLVDNAVADGFGGIHPIVAIEVP